jgi:hypothetical protein
MLLFFAKLLSVSFCHYPIYSMRKQILFIAPFFFACTALFAQNSESAAPRKFATNESKLEEALAKTPQGQNNIRLGLPASANAELYKQEKERLLNENPAKYKELFAAKGMPANKTTITREKYNLLPDLQKKRIEEHPEVFIIID